MRLRFADDEERQRVCDEIDRLWQRATPGLQSPSDAVQTISEIAAELDPRLDVETVGELERPTTIVVTPRGERRLRPLVDLFVERAPRVEGTELVSHAPPRATPDALELVRREHGCDLSGARARAGFSRGHLLEVVVYAKCFGGVADEPSLVAAERAVEALLGERVLDVWIGRVSAEPLAGGGPLVVLNSEQAPTFPLAELPATVGSAVEVVKGALPKLSALGVPRDGWALFEAKPAPRADYAAQDDVAVATSALPEMLKCFLEGSPFSSHRFASGGELFAYLKIDAGEESFETRLADRTALEDRLGDLLAEHKIGAVVGNGLGLRYVYVDLALAPTQSAIDVVVDAARSAGVGERSWLLFCDAEYADEWLPIWPSTPPPPRP